MPRSGPVRGRAPRFAAGRDGGFWIAHWQGRNNLFTHEHETFRGSHHADRAGFLVFQNVAQRRGNRPVH